VTAFEPPVVPFGQRLAEAVIAKKNPICVGLDPRSSSLPEGVRPRAGASLEEHAEAYARFCCDIIDVVGGLVPIVKPQAAFFEELGPHGMVALGRVVRYATERQLLVVMDAKRGDIGTTATAYANAFLGSGPEGSAAYSPWGADALTVNPFLGADTLVPFSERCDSSGAGLFVLVKTSNPGSGFLQDVQGLSGLTDVAGSAAATVPAVQSSMTISEKIADHVQSMTQSTRGAAGYGSIGAVVGATYPHQLEAMRQRMPHAWLLIPGYGAQGGSAADVVLGMDDRGLGAIVNSSRGIIFAHENPKLRGATWTDSVRNATLEMIEALTAARR
jgi:orotidine-5'-phosphate decarboxylase